MNARMACGLGMILTALAGLYLPWIHAAGTWMSVSQTRALCRSDVGQLTQLLSAGARHGCMVADGGWLVFVLLGAAGAVVSVAGFLARANV